MGWIEMRSSAELAVEVRAHLYPEKPRHSAILFPSSCAGLRIPLPGYHPRTVHPSTTTSPHGLHAYCIVRYCKPPSSNRRAILTSAPLACSHAHLATAYRSSPPFMP